jgi:hypothetical protein
MRPGDGRNHEEDAMRKTTGNMLATTMLTLGLAGGAMTGVAHAQSGVARITGTWDVTLTVRNCTTGATVATIKELATFNRGGTLVSSTAGVPQSGKTPGHGRWSHRGGFDYDYAFKFFRFDAAGALAGWTIIRQAAQVAPHGDEYTAEGGAEVYAPDGTRVGTGCSSVSASRFE